MKTQLLITVKPDLLMWYSNLPIWFLSKKPYIGLYIDKTAEEGGELIQLKISKKPHVIEVEPGHHDFMFVDSNSSNKSLISGVTKLAVGLGLGAFTGSISGMASGVSVALDSINANKEIRDNYMHLCLNEGDLFKISVKPGKRGTVKIREFQ